MRTASLLFGSAFFSLLVSARVSNSHRRSLDAFEIARCFHSQRERCSRDERCPTRSRTLHVQRATLDDFPCSRSSLDNAINRPVSHRRKREDRDVVSKRRIILPVHARDQRYSQVQRTTMNFSRPATPWLELRGFENERRARRRIGQVRDADKEIGICMGKAASERQRRRMAKREEKSVARNYNKGSIVGRFFPLFQAGRVSGIRETSRNGRAEGRSSAIPRTVFSSWSASESRLSLSAWSFCQRATESHNRP